MGGIHRIGGSGEDDGLMETVGGIGPQKDRAVLIGSDGKDQFGPAPAGIAGGIIDSTCYCYGATWAHTCTQRVMTYLKS